MPNNHKRGEEALSHLERELKSRERKEKTRPLGVAVASLVVILALVGGIWFATSRDNNESVTAEDQTSQPATPTEQPTATALTGKLKEALPATVTCEYKKDGEDAHGATVPDAKDVSTTGTATVTFKTNKGDIGLKLDRAVAPCTVNAITHLASEKFYDGSVCHRMTSGGLNVLQCGDPTGTGSGGPGFGYATEYPYTEKDSLGSQVLYPKGSVAMARTQDPNSNGSQFFLNYEDSTLAPDYTYFGTIDEAGMQTLAKIAKTGVKDDAQDGAPKEEVQILSATLAS